jgi:hypothetical protein
VQVEWSHPIYPLKEATILSEVPSATSGVLIFFGSLRGGSWVPLGVSSADDIQAECLEGFKNSPIGYQTAQGYRLKNLWGGCLLTGLIYCKIPNPLERRGAEQYLANIFELWTLRRRESELCLPVNLPW